VQSLRLLWKEDRVLITVSEAARRLDTYPNAINRWIANGELEAFRVEGRGFRFVDAEQVKSLGLALKGLRGAAGRTSSALDRPRFPDF